MNTHNLKILLTIPLLSGTLCAQASPNAQALLMAMQANGKQVVTYQWKQKSTILRKGSAVGFKISIFHPDLTSGLAGDSAVREISQGIDLNEAVKEFPRNYWALREGPIGGSNIIS